MACQHVSAGNDTTAGHHVNFLSQKDRTATRRCGTKRACNKTGIKGDLNFHQTCGGIYDMANVVPHLENVAYAKNEFIWQSFLPHGRFTMSVTITS